MGSKLATTRMSSKGQVVIPEEARKELGLETGARFIVLWQDGVVLLKAIAEPSREEFEALLDRMQENAGKAGRTRKDVKKTIAKVRDHN